MAEPIEQRARRLCHDLRHVLGCDIHPRAYGLILAALRDAERRGAEAVREACGQPSEEEIEAATEAIVQGDRVQMQGSGLEPSSEKLRLVYRDFACAALLAAANVRSALPSP